MDITDSALAAEYSEQLDAVIEQIQYVNAALYLIAGLLFAVVVLSFFIMRR